MSDFESKPPRILLVEDDENLGAGLKLNFELEGYDAVWVGTGREAEQCLASTSFDAVVLDIMLPDTNGFAVCRKIRQSGVFTPVLMLTARSEAHDRITGLDAGADDYLAKPFELSELFARLRSMLRRTKWEKTSARDEPPCVVAQFGNAEINFETHEVKIGQQLLNLTHIEMQLVRYFWENSGRVISRDELLERVWKLGNYPNTRTVDNFIVRLRKYFEVNPAHPKHFLSIRGTGYKFMK